MATATAATQGFIMVTSYQRLYQATDLLRAEADWQQENPGTDVCACCRRGWPEVELPDRGIPFQYGNPSFYRNRRYNKQYSIEWHCVTCQTLRIGSFSVLGLERMSTAHQPVAQRLSMLGGGGAVITVDNTLHLAIKPGHWPKFKEGMLVRLGRVRVCQPLELLLQLAEEGALGRIENGVVFIEDFGRQSEGLMRQLLLTTSWTEVWANGFKGPRMIEVKKLFELYEVLLALGYLDKACRPSFWRPIADVAAGKHDPESLNRWAQEIEGSADIAACLPIDPHARKRLHLDLRLIRRVHQG